MKVINLYGGPGVGKSTLAAGVFTALKMKGHNVELVAEFAKDLTWEDRHKTLKNQNYVTAKQHHKLWRLKDSVDVVVTDSPLLLGIAYTENIYIKAHIVNLYNEFNNINYMVKRNLDIVYDVHGRTKDEYAAMDKDIKIINILDDLSVKMGELVECNQKGIDEIVKDYESIIIEEYNINTICKTCGRDSKICCFTPKLVGEIYECSKKCSR